MKYFTTILGLFAFFSAYTQTFTNYTTADGLVNNAVNCVAVDLNDNVWFGTQGGLSYFDGSSWTNYSKEDYPELINNAITAIAVDSEDNLWIGTDFGLNKFDGLNWETFTEADGLSDDRIKFIAESPDGSIWVANSGGVSTLDLSGNWSSITTTDGLPFGGVSFVTFDNNGVPYLGTLLGGVYGLTEFDWIQINETHGLASNKVTSIAFDENNDLWIGTSDGLSHYTTEEELIQHHPRIFQLPPPDTLNPIEDVQIDSKGNIWVGVWVDYLLTVGGVSFYDTENPWIDYDETDGVVGPVVRRLDIDSQDIVWVTTSSGVTRIGEFTSSTTDLLKTDFIIYPNPTDNYIHISQNKELIGTSYALIDINGRLLKKGIIDDSKFTIDVSDILPQLTLLKIDQKVIRKIIIQ